MKRSVQQVLFVIGLIISIRFSPPPKPFKQQTIPEKKYKVEYTLQEWGTKLQVMDYIKNTLRQSDLPSRQVAYISDSLLTPLEQEISLQVNRQVADEKPKIDSTNKQNKKQ